VKYFVCLRVGLQRRLKEYLNLVVLDSSTFICISWILEFFNVALSFYILFIPFYLEMDPLTSQAAAAVASAGTNRVKEIFVNWKNENLNLKSMRAWGGFCDRSKLSIPKFTEIHIRLKSNLSYFQTNYIAVFALLLIYCIITNPWFLLVVGLCGGFWLYIFHYRAEPIMVRGHEVTSREKTIGLTVVTLFLFYIAGVTNSIFWLLGASIAVTLLHALFFTPVEESDFDFHSTFPPGQQQV